ncbi:limulus clotting factor C-like [Anneissia japonica]|uniref:limulus clotting factor C-like n=1 Tax=Anneissia japonica TaxID=1529436 RepID=UPI0014257FD3|nr:limulus clotting factor C-like [Anneissia japonica]
MGLRIGESLLAFCIVVTLLERVNCIGIPTGCDDGLNYCSCGDTVRTFSLSFERCTYFYRWRPYCKECNKDIDFAAQCAQFAHCKTCDNDVESCVSCPTDRYGKWCDQTCNCQNNGQCNSDGSCTCTDLFEGEKCERRIPVYCPSLDIPPNAKLTEDVQTFLGGTSVTFACHKNYQLIGQSRLYCDYNGVWIGDSPKCEPICEALETPNGAVAIVTSVPGTSIVRSIFYDCLKGYQIQGLGQVNCREDGTWSGEPPVCVAKCAEPLPPANGRIFLEGGLLEGSRVSYVCDKGYILKGTRKRQCGADRQWTEDSPICDPIECGIPDIPQHGYLSATNFTYRGVVTYTCEENYLFTEPGLEARLCQYNGKWSGTTPQCVKDISCPDPGVVTNAVRVPDADAHTFYVGDIISFSCADAFRMVSGDDTRVCLKTGLWSGEQPTCVPETACEDPGVPEYSVREVEIVPLALSAKKSRSFGRTRLTHSSSSQSESSLVESESVSASESISEQEPADQQESQQDVDVLFEGYFTSGTQLTYRCKSNLYKLYGLSQISCSNGQWSGRNPTCKPVCGKATGEKQAYVFGGNDTISGQWPWHTAVHQHRNGKSLLICGGSVITDTLVLTAAHCVRERSSKREFANTTYTVEVGKYYRNYHNRDQEWIQSINVTEIFVHHNYNPFTLEGDIAVLRLEKAMNYTSRVRPVCIPTLSGTKRNLKPGNKGVLTGWGKTHGRKHGLPDVLQQATIPVVSRLRCQRNYQNAYPDNHNIIVTRNMFCAGFEEGGVDSCTGDSGGPMVFSRGEGEMKSWYIEGIVSWGSPGGQCGLPNEFGVYTKVSKYLSWLNEFGISN